MVADLRSLCDLLCTREPNWEEILLDSERCTIVTFCNPQTLDLALRFPEFISLIEQFDLVFSDGILLSRVAGVLRSESVPRVSFDGNSLAAQVFRIASQHGLSIALVGAKAGVADKAATLLSGQGANIQYFRNGYFSTTSDENECIDSIVDKDIRIAIVGMGGFFQEQFALKLRASGWRGTLFTCGGYLDQLAEGSLTYYPRLINDMNLRAPYRVLKEPGRLIPRYTLGYLPFYKSSARALLSKIYSAGEQ